MPMSNVLTKAVWLLAICTATMVTAEPRKPAIVSRAEWGARDPIFEMTKHRPQRITIHHSATPQKVDRSLSRKMQLLQTFSQSNELLADGRRKKAWADVPYHFMIGVSGDIAEGRNIKRVGDTNTNYDPAGHIGIVLEGNFENIAPNDAQIDALIALLAHLSRRYRIDVTQIDGHKSFASTACPGKHLEAMLPD